MDLKDYILPDAEKSFRSLRDQGLFDFAAPEKAAPVAASGRAKRWRAGNPMLPDGRYLLRVYGKADTVGQVVYRAKWRAGDGAMTTVSSADVRK